MTISPELQTAFKHYQSHGGYSSPPGRAASNLRDARADLQLQQLIEAGVARIVVHPCDMPWDGDHPYDGPLFRLEVHIGDDVDHMGGIATGMSDIVDHFDPDGLQATSGDFGGYGGQCTVRGYLRVCAVEMAQGMEDFDSEYAMIASRAKFPTLESATVHFLGNFRRVGGFHPEDDMWDIGTRGPDGQWVRCFDDAEAADMRAALDVMYANRLDPCAVAMAAFPPDAEMNAREIRSRCCNRTLKTHDGVTMCDYCNAPTTEDGKPA